MDIQERLSMSYYKEIAVINEEHEITLVQNLHTRKIFVKKILETYNVDVYRYLKDHPIPHTPRIYDLFQCYDRLVIIEEYITGDTLESLLSQGYSFTESEIRDIVIQLCDILSCLHACQPPIIHRDIKPSNIIKTPANVIFLLDMNAAKYQSDEKQEDTTLLGTKGYAAPEQYGFGTSNVQTDIYALGMLINTLVLGEFSTTPKRDHPFYSIIKKCTQLNPADRYKDVSSIKRLLHNKSVQSESETVPLTGLRSYLPPGFRTLHPLKMLVAAIGYFAIFSFSLSMQIENASPPSLAIQRGFLLVMLLSIVLCTFNYRNIQQASAFNKARGPFFRIAYIVMLDFMIFSTLLVLMICITALLP